MSKRLTLFAAFLMCISVLSAQKVDRAVAHSIARYFNEYASDRCVTKFAGLDKRRNNVVVNKKSKTVRIFCNEAFYGQPFTQETVDTIYQDIRALLPSPLRKYKLEVCYNGKSIEDCVPNICRKKNIAKERLLHDVEYEGAPWVKNVSRPYVPFRGLEGRHLAVGSSHGRYYSGDDSVWKWQRPSLFCTVEDLFTQSVVLPFLVPMLENAGALVYTPRERDPQPNCVIVDNDIRSTGSRYIERGGKRNGWSRDTVGYAASKDIYIDGDNPFVMGTARLADATPVGSRSESTVSWLPMIPSDGEYAVYVAYRTHENSVSDARYTVMHAGGMTVYEVNQRMGGGTWVYLGTHRFNEGRSKTQGVFLTTASDSEGVVSADAVRFGGGTGNVARGKVCPVTSGMPRYLEGARYNLQTSGFPLEVYSAYEGENDYRDDINSRSNALNYLSGGSVYNPDTAGLNVPLEFSLGFHSDAGFSRGDSLVGSVGVVTTEFNGDTLETGHSRYISRDFVSFALNNLQDDIRNSLGFEWPVRGIIDRSYSESRIPNVTSVIFESLSHQNFADLLCGFDPNFKFILARSVYKSLLKHISYVHGKDYVVQPLPVKNFCVELSPDGKEAVLKWAPVEDLHEPTAKAKKYIVYIKTENGGYDDGIVVKKPHFTLPVSKNRLYTFKVVALNDGGCSMPSEELSLFLSSDSPKKVLVVNGFHRMGAPHAVVTDKKAGFDMEVDPGVPYISTAEYCGNQLDLLRENIGYENGLGLSGSEFEGKRIAGNAFNYPYIHGKALAANGITFVSCGSDAVISGDVDMNSYDAVDIILGVEKQGGAGLFNYGMPYKTFPDELQAKIKEYCDNGGRLFVSGAHLASDMLKNGNDKRFIRNVLRFDYGGSVTECDENMIAGSGLELPFVRTPNEACYAVPSTDVLVPLDDAFVAFVFKGNRKSAGVAYQGRYRTLSTSFPFEAIADEAKREKLMGAIMRFLFR